MIGTQLGGRYEILERIGGGGMALVYKGHDILLNRKVAVKVLRQQYVHDEEFIRRFRREAQAAASLSHPNVVSIYDVGQQDEVHYIVMEYVEGTTLNEVIKEKAPLQVEEAIHYASQICDALDHAHHNQIIHRDIKPHNILIGKNGRVKVTDFGIARAVTSSTITQTGSVVGSVHYFSPEHAKGIAAGAKSDLYSLGIVLYQMLTGRLPFLGESPISVALKHLQETVEDPRKVNPLIPQSVENIILKTMRKNPDERYQSAKQMMSDLESCLLPERRNEAKIVFDDDEDDAEKTRVIPAIRADHFEDDAEEDEERSAAPRMKKKKMWIKPLVWLILLIMLAVAMWFLVGWAKKQFTVAVPIPDVVSLQVEEAKQKLEDVQLKYNIIPQFSDTVPNGIVIRQDPSKMKLKINSVVDLYVSQGVEKQKMPNYVGKNVKDVKLDLTQGRGLKDEQIKTEELYLDDPPGTVVKQSPAADEEYDQDKVNVVLTVSKGRQTFQMPDLVGKTLDEAKAKLDVIGLKLDENGIDYQPSTKQDKGKVIKQFPYEAGDEVSQGSEISKLILSSGLPADAGTFPVSVPVKPATDGKTSTISIILSDAKYDNFEIKTLKVTKPALVEVHVIVQQGTPAKITVKQDDAIVNIITKTYQDYLDWKNGKPAAAKPSGTSDPSGAGQTQPPAKGTGSGTGNGSGTGTTGSTGTTKPATGTSATTTGSTPAPTAGSAAAGTSTASVSGAGTGGRN